MAHYTPVCTRIWPIIHPWVWWRCTLLHPWVWWGAPYYTRGSWRMWPIIHPWVMRDVAHYTPGYGECRVYAHPGMGEWWYMPTRVWAGCTSPGICPGIHSRVHPAVLPTMLMHAATPWTEQCSGREPWAQRRRNPWVRPLPWGLFPRVWRMIGTARVDALRSFWQRTDRLDSARDIPYCIILGLGHVAQVLHILDIPRMSDVAQRASSPSCTFINLEQKEASNPP